ncbi:MAG TPA: J domain-containing protein [Oculatellaceae cyanobacterium]|jgi:DnaJ-domain-containing protein 1
MNSTAFFTTHSLPVFEYLSADSKRQLEVYLLAGNTEFRQKRLLEFFKTLDWLPPEDVLQDRLMRKLEPDLRARLTREIRAYQEGRLQDRAKNAEKRDDYKRRVIEAFRTKVSTADKLLLESLRDFELNLTGRDVNWRYYFTLDSFKKIEAFVNASSAERQALFECFRKDVETYKRNYEKIRQAQAVHDCAHEFSFDDWCETVQDADVRFKRTSRKETKSEISMDNPVYRAHRKLGVPVGASPDLVKKQFRKLTLRHHPDLPNGCAETMKELVGAYQEIQRYWQKAGL